MSHLLSSIAEEKLQHQPACISMLATSKILPDQSALRIITERAIGDNMETLLACKGNEANPSMSSQLTMLVPNVVELIRVASTVGILTQIDGPFEEPTEVLHKSVTGKYFSCLFFVFDNVVEIEDTVWSPMIGLKGQIDVIVTGHHERRAYAEDLYQLLLSFRESILAAAVGTSGYSRLTNPLHSEPMHSFSVPFEIKTGKWRSGSVLPHRAQTMMYLLMMWLRERSCSGVQHRFNSERNIKYQYPDFGLLAYVGNDILKIEVVYASWTDLRSMVMARNNQAMYINQGSEALLNPLPPVLQSSSQCSSCFQAAECMMYHSISGQDEKDSSGTPELFDYSTRGFLNSQHKEYFSLWNRLLDLEASTAVPTLYEIWAVPSTIIEDRGGSCLGQLQLKKCDSDIDFSGQYRLLLSRCNSYYGKGGVMKTEEYKCCFNVGDKVIVSLEKIDLSETSTGVPQYVEPNLCAGAVSSIKMELKGDTLSLIITVTVSKAPKRLLGIFKLKENGPCADIAPKHWRVRLDSDEFSFGVATLRTNLLKLFASPHSPNNYREFLKEHGNGRTSAAVEAQIVAGQPRMRTLLIDLSRPEFDRLSCDDVLAPTYGTGSILAYTVPDRIAPIGSGKIYPGCLPADIRQEVAMLNEGQNESVKKVVCAKDYVLMLGMPGTG